MGASVFCAALLGGTTWLYHKAVGTPYPAKPKAVASPKPPLHSRMLDAVREKLDLKKPATT